MNSILSHLNSTSCSVSDLPFTTRSSKWNFPPFLSSNILHKFITRLLHTTCFVHLIPVDLIALTELGEEQNFLANTDSSCFQTLITHSNPLRNIYVHCTLCCYVLCRLCHFPYPVPPLAESHQLPKLFNNETHHRFLLTGIKPSSLLKPQSPPATIPATVPQITQRITLSFRSR